MHVSALNFRKILKILSWDHHINLSTLVLIDEACDEKT
jgi:hypothetical protein